MNSSTSPSSIPSESSNQLNPIAVFEALGSKIRWPILQLLADGTPRSAADVASALHLSYDNVSRHLTLMWKAGLVAPKLADDQRIALYYVPAENREQPGKLDYGICTVQMPTARPFLPKD
ncbi:MAG TPA: helix-turn-helix domain-containing protein [Verrucomicrobiae bacterium]|nr:helix-turn-helix domain-containing protein [Verrucomicrobiae bacterium]